MRHPICGFALAALLAATSASAAASTPSEAARTLLDAYARGDKATVMSMVDPHDIHVYGTDISEVAADPAAFERMFEADQKLWGGKAKFGEMSHVSTIRTRNLATLFFDISFSVGSQPPLQVRFATVWRREHGMWKLVQSTNAVPTVGQSASEILAKPHH